MSETGLLRGAAGLATIALLAGLFPDAFAGDLGAAPAPTSSLGISTPQASSEKKRGSLDPVIVDAAIRRHAPQIQECWEKEASARPGTKGGKMLAHLVIGTDGRVSSSSIERTTMNEKAVEDCIADQIKAVRFPKPRGGGTVTVNYPFLFSIKAAPEAADGAEHRRKSELGLGPAEGIPDQISRLSEAARAAAVSGSSLVITLTSSAIAVQGEIVETTDLLAEDGNGSAPSMAAALQLRRRTRPAAGFTLIAAPGVRYQVVKKVVFVAQASGFTRGVDFQLATISGGAQHLAQMPQGEGTIETASARVRAITLVITKSSTMLIDGARKTTLSSSFDSAALKKGLRDAGSPRSLVLVVGDDVAYGDFGTALRTCVDAGVETWSTSGSPL